jgi:hypothetical protein
MKKVTFEWLLWFALFILNANGVFHELGHALAALLEGYQVYGFGASWRALYVSLSGTDAFVSFAGGFAQLLVFAFLALALIRLHPPPANSSIWDAVWNGGRAENSEFYLVLVYLLVCYSLLVLGYAAWEAGVIG